MKPTGELFPWLDAVPLEVVARYYELRLEGVSRLQRRLRREAGFGQVVARRLAARILAESPGGVRQVDDVLYHAWRDGRGFERIVVPFREPAPPRRDRSRHGRKGAAP